MVNMNQICVETVFFIFFSFNKMVLTNYELWTNATACFAKYHLDNGGTITNYNTCQFMVEYTINEIDYEMTITKWDYSTTQPSVAFLKTTYSVSDLATINHYFEDINAIRFGGVLFTNDRIFLTDYALKGTMIYDTIDDKMYIFNGTIWREISLV